MIRCITYISPKKVKPNHESRIVYPGIVHYKSWLESWSFWESPKDRERYIFYGHCTSRGDSPRYALRMHSILFFTVFWFAAMSNNKHRNQLNLHLLVEKSSQKKKRTPKRTTGKGKEVVNSSKPTAVLRHFGHNQQTKEINKHSTTFNTQTHTLVQHQTTNSHHASTSPVHCGINHHRFPVRTRLHLSVFPVVGDFPENVSPPAPFLPAERKRKKQVLKGLQGLIGRLQGPKSILTQGTQGHGT